MTRLSIDSKIQRDPRFKMLATALNISLHEARSRCLDVWFVCYDRRAEAVPARWIDTAADFPGFADGLVAADLAELDGNLVRVRGVDQRVTYLRNADERGRQGGLKSGESRRVKRSKGTLRITRSTRFAKSNPTAAAIAPAVAVAVAGALSELRDHDRDGLAVLEALGRYTGIPYRGAKPHLRLIAARMADGASALDLRKVAWFCAMKLGWQHDEKMRRYLRPETLYGPQTIARYLDASLAAYRAEYGTDDDVSTK